jgi:hypothetical protein
VLGHQDCMRGLRERGVIHDPCKGTAPVAATRPVEEQRLDIRPTTRCTLCEGYGYRAGGGASRAACGACGGRGQILWACGGVR